MEKLHLPSNIKVHYAAQEKPNYAVAAKTMGLSYGLYTAFPFVAKRLFGKSVWPIIKMKHMTDIDVDVPTYINANMRHTIQDSGLFSLLFGKHKDKATKEFVYKWYDELIRFTSEHGQDVTCVEVDAQAILGVEETWALRERMRQDLPNNRIINVFHVEDGKDGLDRLIEFSDYIAIGSGVTGGNVLGYKCLCEYIKTRKPEIDIHLLGCTNVNIMHQVRHLCTSCDSTSWLSAPRFGYIGDYHIRDIDKDKVMAHFGKDVWDSIREYNGDLVTKCTIVSTELCKESYIKFCGNQD